mmetsp:Transcript_18313/g.42765  ORF Transcript_18313/g.42765 Transcript_18313/m.42765 type:complete len:235 (+) Transcript_18313:146-850(+)
MVSLPEGPSLHYNNMESNPGAATHSYSRNEEMIRLKVQRCRHVVSCLQGEIQQRLAEVRIIEIHQLHGRTVVTFEWLCLEHVSITSPMSLVLDSLPQPLLNAERASFILFTMVWPDVCTISHCHFGHVRHPVDPVFFVLGLVISSTRSACCKGALRQPGNELPAGSATHGISRDVNLSSVNARQSDKAGDKVFHPPFWIILPCPLATGRQHHHLFCGHEQARLILRLLCCGLKI